ncbi:MAG: hypothetical protein HQM09_04285 [Candidatus Riflebacteria bacterium]|nr:hypothetical protein [Candidatus Riflebacteria bacterium]
MKKTWVLFLAMAIVSFLPSLVAAAVVPLADAQVEITIPDGWTQDTKDNVVSIAAPDKTMSVAFFSISGDSDSKAFDVVDKAVEKTVGAVKWEKDGKGVPEEINGMKGETYEGTAKDGKLQVECIWLATAPGKNLYIYWFDTVDSEKKYQKEIDVIVKGLKPLAAKEEKKEEKK